MSSDDHWQPRLHFTAPGHWINDPNGLIVHDGIVHLFYQVNPQGLDWGNISWGHASSDNYLDWRDHGVAIPDTPEEASFSGCIVYDENNTSGLGAGGRGPLVALYTGAKHDNYVDQHQNLAYSNDGGNTWTRHSANPVLQSPQFDIRDPKVFWHAPSRRWIMTLVHADRHEVGFYGSSNLIDWRLLSVYGNDGCKEGEWECSDLVEFPVDGSEETKHVLFVSVAEGLPSGGSGVQYFVGDFDGTRFSRSGCSSNDPGAGTCWVDRGPDFYAAQSWYNVPQEQRRVVMSAWMSNRDYASVTPTSGWRGCHVLPRELVLERQQDRLRLRQQPVRELDTCRGEEVVVDGMRVEGRVELDRYGIKGTCFELRLTMQSATGSLRISVLADEAFATHVLIDADADAGTVSLDRRSSGEPFDGESDSRFARLVSAPLPTSLEGTELRLLVDRSTLEVFVDKGRVVFSSLVFPPKAADSIRLSAPGSAVEVGELRFWPLFRQAMHAHE